MSFNLARMNVAHFPPALIKLHIATINNRGFPKTADTSVCTHFIRYFRTHNLDSPALQGTYASSDSLQQVFHTQIQAQDNLWSRHCSLVCLSSGLSFSDSIFNGVTPAGSFTGATFHRGLSRSCIDYIFVTPDLINSKHSSCMTYIQHAWSDHCLVTLHMRLPTPVSDTVEQPPATKLISVDERQISKLIHPTSREICTSPTELQEAARTFYFDPYSPDPIDDSASQDILISIPSSLSLSAGDQNSLTSPIECDDLMEQVHCCPSKGSQGLDDIPYEILLLLFTHPDCKPIKLQVYNDGLTQFRFIADNGLLIKLIMEYSLLSSSSMIGLLLDQEKAYDCIHPDYLHQVLQQFAFPDSIIGFIRLLFLSPELQFNINSFLSDPISQSHVLHQSDPLSPVLFNLAFEPLLRSLFDDQNFKGLQLPRSPMSASSPETSAPVKLTAYTDDVVCYLEDPEGFTILHNYLSIYSRASKPKFLDKIVRSIVSAREVYSHRFLSVRGRVTILNSLILSRLWHVIRALFPSLCTSRRLGGLNVLDPAIQLDALQHR
ncbi:hypothetical protein G6F32_010402 [Rhizopus arrhizus]|nr:hypothetical protein G6F32_010402 [Rhizopus arrhizus]